MALCWTYIIPTNLPYYLLSEGLDTISIGILEVMTTSIK